jgi:aminopeptidase N
MKWWDDLWLSEGFATWVSSKVVHQWHPEWKLDVAAVLSAERAKNEDSLLSHEGAPGNRSTG